MTGAARTPRPVALTALGTAALVSLVAVAWPKSPALPFVGRVAELSLAAAAAYLLDDAAAPLTSVTPQGPWLRRAPVLVTGGLVLGGAWLGVLLILQWRAVPLPLGAASLELLVLALSALAVGALLARHGEPEPGALGAPAVALLGLALIILEGALRSPIFLTSAEPTAARVTCWVVVGLAAALVVVAAGGNGGSWAGAR
jgi:hypothetical protein